MGQQCLGVGPTFVLLADQVVAGNQDIFKVHFVETVLAIDSHDRLNRDTRCFHIDQQKANALLLAHIFGGANQTKNPVGILGKGGPDLGTIDQVVVTSIFSGGR